MEDHKGLTGQGITGPHLLLMLLSCVGAGISLYLTSHYMDVNFPSGLNEGSLCDINSTFNCDASSSSIFSNIAGIPISAFGFLFCINLLIASIFPSAEYEKTNHLIAWINIVGCVTLLLFSVFVLGSFCPFCMGYWTVSALILFLFHKFALKPALPDLKIGIILGLLGITIIGWFGYDVADREAKTSRMSYALAKQFQNLPKVQIVESPHKVHMGTNKFFDAPLRISKFSDFQCPACKSFADIIPALVKRYGEKLNIQYFFYPLDSNCNKNLERQLHPLACQAAYLAHCSGEKFHDIHDQIFENQRNLSQTWIDDKAKELGILECKNSKETNDFVVSHIIRGDEYKVQSTPTLVINGRKISGSLPLNQLYLLLDEVLKL